MELPESWVCWEGVAKVPILTSPPLGCAIESTSFFASLSFASFLVKRERG